jgi:hypothetical protein
MRISTSYLDAGGDGAVLPALRAHRMKAATIADYVGACLTTLPGGERRG